jgi:hypothetical protein
MNWQEWFERGIPDWVFIVIPLLLVALVAYVVVLL